jgi:hypothetical protein
VACFPAWFVVHAGDFLAGPGRYSNAAESRHRPGSRPLEALAAGRREQLKGADEVVRPLEPAQRGLNLGPDPASCLVVERRKELAESSERFALEPRAIGGCGQAQGAATRSTTTSAKPASASSSPIPTALNGPGSPGAGGGSCVCSRMIEIGWR